MAPSSSGLGRRVFIPKTVSSNLTGVTKSEIKESVGSALAAHPSADSAAKGKFKFAESRRKKRMKKNAKILGKTKP